MIREFARALVIVMVILFIVAEVQQLDEMNDALIVRPQ